MATAKAEIEVKQIPVVVEIDVEPEDVVLDGRFINNRSLRKNQPFMVLSLDEAEGRLTHLRDIYVKQEVNTGGTSGSLINPTIDGIQIIKHLIQTPWAKSQEVA